MNKNWSVYDEVSALNGKAATFDDVCEFYHLTQPNAEEKDYDYEHEFIDEDERQLREWREQDAIEHARMQKLEDDEARAKAKSDLAQGNNLEIQEGLKKEYAKEEDYDIDDAKEVTYVANKNVRESIWVHALHALVRKCVSLTVLYELMLN